MVLSSIRILLTELKLKENETEKYIIFDAWRSVLT